MVTAQLGEIHRRVKIQGSKGQRQKVIDICQNEKKWIFFICKFFAKKLHIFVKKNYIFWEKIFPRENRHRQYAYAALCIDKFCKEYLPLRKSNKKSYLRLEIITYWVTDLLSDKVGHRNSVRCLKSMSSVLGIFLGCMPTFRALS